jgi:pimeloyl-ACP methyl ester carboxylesterase
MSGKTRALSFVVLAVLILASYGPGSASGSAVGPQAVFQTAPCSSLIGSQALSRAHVRCGYLVVPENRQVKDSPRIKVAVAIFKAPGPNPAPDPLIFVVGGPGGEAILSRGPTMVTKGLPAFVGNRDYILVNQRGTLLSQPALTCPANATLQACHAYLVKEGIDPGAYNVVQDAADIAALGPALGYKTVDLYGNSYGSLVALQAMRDHPQGIRAVVLDGVLTSRYDQFTDLIPNAWRALQQIFTDCAASPSCTARYPHLAQTFTRLLSQLQVHPASFRVYSSVQKSYATATLTGVGLWTSLATYLMDSTVLPFVPQPTLAPLVPRLITDMAKGDFSDAVQYLEAIHFDQPSTQSGLMAASMVCSFNEAGNSPATIAASAKVLPASIRAGAVAYYASSLASCTAWDVPSIAAVNHTYFRSAIPTLLLSGRYDPVASPEKTQALATTLWHAYLVPVPLGHHAVEVGGCPDRVVRAFLANPNQKPDTSCVAQMTVHWQ